ncbi:MAG: sugar transferase [Candidatus Neomarinimicrobiota bacterium]|nr:sugar transferase [Candidatus Neomarinimicrobiota bacterium]RKY50107.1 MAG: sugar transferase [Candidatus Neomarinimicrobiota bacterium]RKY54699.1 MAG: sugar transferase [Candidatus Neomarinimicrobiota bacterium]
MGGDKKKSLQLKVKYMVDKFLAVIGLLLLMPVFLVVSVVLKLMGYRVFYLQKRVGENGRDFYLYKFTTMPEGSEKLGFITTANDQRPFGFGRFLRKMKINEIPQLINVLNGTMSFVGPRPLIREQLKEVFSEEEIREYYRMRPGITGAGSLWYHHEDVLLAQVSDPYKFYRKVVMPRKMELERAYAEKWSLWLDAKILLMTLLVLSVSRVGVIDSKNLFYRCFEKVFREF